MPRLTWYPSLRGVKWVTEMDIYPTEKASERGVDCHGYEVETADEPTKELIEEIIKERGGDLGRSKYTIRQL